MCLKLDILTTTDINKALSAIKYIVLFVPAHSEFAFPFSFCGLL